MEYTVVDQRSLGLIYFDHTKDLSATIRSSELSPLIYWVFFSDCCYVGFDYLFEPDTRNPQATTEVVPLEDEPLKNKQKRKHHSKKEKPHPTFPLTANPLYLDNETNSIVIAYKGAISYSSVLARRRVGLQFYVRTNTRAIEINVIPMVLYL